MKYIVLLIIVIICFGRFGSHPPVTHMLSPKNVLVNPSCIASDLVIVVEHTGGELSWLNSINTPFLIYSRSEDRDAAKKKYSTGSSVPLQFIVEYYDVLPTLTLFLKGDGRNVNSILKRLRQRSVDFERVSRRTHWLCFFQSEPSDEEFAVSGRAIRGNPHQIYMELLRQGPRLYVSWSALFGFP